MRMVVIAAVGLAFLSLGTPWSQGGAETGAAETSEGEPSTLTKLRNAVEAQLKKDEAPLAELDEIYRGHLNQLRQASSRAGQLEQVLSIQAELDSIGKRGKRSYESFPRLQEMHQVYVERRAATADQVEARQNQTLETGLRSLSEMKRRLTKEGNLDEALAIDREEKRLEKLLARGPAKETPAELFANCDNEFALAHNGKLIATGNDKQVNPVKLDLMPGDVLVAKVVDGGLKKGFACVIKRQGAKPIVSNPEIWRSFTPRNADDWMKTDADVPTSPSDTATNQIWKDRVEEASGTSCEAVWPLGDEKVGYLMLTIEN